MVVALTPGETWDYVLEEDRERPEDERTTFLLATLDYEAHREIHDKALGTTRGGISEGSLEIRQGSAIDKILRCGLRGWRNFKDTDGHDVEFKTETVHVFAGKKRIQPTTETLGRLSQQWCVELAEAIQRNNRVEVAERGN